MDTHVRQQVYSTIATVLHLGNIEFEDDPDDNRGGCRVTDDSEESLQVVASLMGLDADELRRSLTASVMQAAKGGYKGTVIMVPLKVHEATNARDALAKAIYSSLFDFIVKQINDSIPFEQSSYYIGVLDIAGFEYFTVNSFEQFCINYCNEKLQQFFNQRILKDEQELYEREGLGVKRISFVDNQDCIDLIEAKGNGIFSLLDEESKLPKPSPQHFASAVHEHNGSHFRLALPRKSKLREHREIRDDDGFIIRHFAGAVCYQTAQFIEKNNDALHASLAALVQECQNAFTQSLFATGDKKSAPKGKLTFISVGSKFQTQLASLMEKLESTGTSFIRCIKPNVKMVARTFEGGSILSQLQCAGMTSVLELMQQGYPSRTQFSELYSMYKKYMPPKLARLDPRLFCKALFKALGLDDNDFKFGLTKVFFRPGKFAEFDQMMKADPKHLQRLIEKVYHWILCSQWKKAQWGALSVIKLKNKIIYRREALVVIQKYARMHLAKKRHAPRFKAIKRLRKLVEQITQIEKMSQNLTKDQAAVKQNAQELNKELQAEIGWVRATFPVKTSVLDARYQLLVDKIYGAIDSAQNKIKDQKIAEEQERMKKLQREMEAEKQRKVDEEKRRAQTEQEKKLKAEMEAKRKVEDAAMQRKLADKAEKVNEEAPTQKFDLSKWKYIEIRDSMNTSCDIELLYACRTEIFRRLRVYREWKYDNAKTSPGSKKIYHVPPCILEEVEKFKQANISTLDQTVNTTQRYFRLDFPRHVENSNGSSEPLEPGRWYAHFDGNWIARQMEVFPDENPTLLMAGKDDNRMCGFHLEETGLTRQKGAEILQKSFEKRWAKYGGPLYTPIYHRKGK
ncbi:hypothetical protein TCAL_03149 [Tigriopus californicus]|uniref:Myosin motor domain-containing protein n=1 Tax=Tigriopus californicus TaxID=6832 RepID=A0A553P1W6_TIGCA|nr:hypothetical protein TCAL_03149 [Tigriopus californicus]|eukprot:TCALIF_03149-PA protein Name:"Similar to MYO6 Unconventional myosin-VI (Gallus gallus)" AED:0.07 eAED:0.07 QI:0/-1/0/1/-1/1/1/0/851